MDKFDKDYDRYRRRVDMYCQSRHIIVHLRAMMNIVHFGSFVDEGLKSTRKDRVMHRSALLESLNECERPVKHKSSLITEYLLKPDGNVNFYMNEPPWRKIRAEALLC